MQDITVLRMVYLDMFFLFLGREVYEDQTTAEYLYSTKSMEI